MTRNTPATAVVARSKLTPTLLDRAAGSAADSPTEAGPQPSASPGMSMSTKRRMIGRPVCQ